MTADTILTRFRDITGLVAGDYADADVTDKAEAYGEALAEEILDETITITTHDTGDVILNEIISWLCAAYAYSTKFRSKVYEGGEMLMWEWFEQQALRLMYDRNPVKLEYIKSRGVFITRDPGVRYSAFMRAIGYDNAGDTTFGGA